MSRRRRFGRVRQLPSGRWQARYLGPDGRLRAAPRTFPRKSDAERWLASAETDLNRGTWRDPASNTITVEQWATRWLESVRPHLKAKTVATYESDLRTKVIPEFGTLTLATVRPIMVNEWVARMTSRGLSASRVRQAYRVLSQVMQSAVHNELIEMTPCRGVRLPRMPDTEPVILDEGEVARLVAELPEPHDLLALLLAYAGLRIGEAFALRRDSVRVDESAIIVSENLVEVSGRLSFDTPKNHQERAVTIPRFVLERLVRHLETTVGREPEALLFVTKRNGRPIHYRAWRQTYFDPARARAGLVDVTPHDLRASHASWVADRHGILAAARRLGHAHASVTTRHYARVVRGRDQSVADDFDARRSVGREESGLGEGARGGHDLQSDPLDTEGTTR